MKSKAIYAEKENKPIIKEVDLGSLKPNYVRVQSYYSSLNYKDALGITGKGKIFRSFPIVPGIDASGAVIDSNFESIKEGDKVLVTGCGLGENFSGGYSQYVDIPGEYVIPIPKNLCRQKAMILGTAGFTAGLAIHRLEENGLNINSGPVLVTGASGGVGAIAINILSKLGYEVWAVTGRSQHEGFLKTLGASKVMSVNDLQLDTKPLGKAMFGATIDNVGGELLSQLLPHINLWGSVASIGLAGGHKIKTTVMPFILRGVSLIGISSTNCPMPLRKLIWEKLAGTYMPNNLEEIRVNKIKLEDVFEYSEKLINRQLYGRTIIKFER